MCIRDRCMARRGIECAGRGELIQTGFLAARNRGTIVCVGAPPITDNITHSPAAHFVKSEKRLLGTLRNEMDGVGHSASRGAGEGGSVIFVGCTNRPDAIDPVRITQSRWTCARGCV